MPIDTNDTTPTPLKQPLTPAERARLRQRGQLLRFRLLQPLPPNDYWRLRNEAETIAAQLAAPTCSTDPHCEKAAPPVYATAWTRATLKRAIRRPSKDAL